MLLSRSQVPAGAGWGPERVFLGAAVAIQLLFFLWIPLSAVREYLFMTYERPPYQAGAANLFIPDLSRFGTRQIDRDVKSQILNPSDVVVPAIYSNRSFGVDLWLEFGGRLAPLTTFDEPLIRTHGTQGANFYGTSPITTSRPLRVVLVVSNVFERADFPALVQRIKDRFVQAQQWIRGPLDPDGRVEIWTADLR
jgi:hypothetical protein